MAIKLIKLAENFWAATKRMSNISAHADKQHHVAASRRVLLAVGLER
jgi:hypothetical protein